MPARKNSLTEIRLQHEAGDGDAEKRERHGIRRHFRPPRRFAEQPGHQDDEGGF
jgi:hypothetical protein